MINPFDTYLFIFLVLANMMAEVENFARVCDAFSTNVSKLRADPVISQRLSTVRIIMDKIMNLERAFILPQGLPKRPQIKYIVV